MLHVQGERWVRRQMMGAARRMMTCGRRQAGGRRVFAALSGPSLIICWSPTHPPEAPA